MNDDKDKAQPWHAADEKPARKRGGAPLGTHSLTGADANVGMPAPARDAERGANTGEPPGAPGPDPLLEPRAQGGDLLGRKG